MIGRRRARTTTDLLDLAADALWRIGARALALLVVWSEAQRQRRALLEMDERLLKDIGLRREDAVREAERLRWTFDREGLRLRR